MLKATEAKRQPRPHAGHCCYNWASTSSEDKMNQRKGDTIVATNAQTSSAYSKSGYAPVNGLEMYYEIHGMGSPLVCIPGGLMTIDMMGALLSSLATTRQVIAVEPQGHGHTADINRPLAYEHMADDTAALISYLGIERADAFGFSMGGGIAMQTAIRHPNAVRKLVVASSPFRSDGEFPEIRALEASFHPDAPMLSPMRDAYVRSAPRPEDWPQLIAKIKQSLAEDCDWTELIGAIQTPTLIVLGDADTFPPAHAVEMFGLLGGGTAESAMGGPQYAQLAILPGTTHFSFLDHNDLLRAIITSFLDAPMPMTQ
jgi:pimeloyl-ACP methyl ester carboxylesterase